MSLNHETVERILQLLSSKQDYLVEAYDHAIELFLTKYPDGTVRKQGRHLQGHTYSTTAKRKKGNDGNWKTIAETPSLERISKLLGEKESTAIERLTQICFLILILNHNLKQTRIN